MLPVKPPHCGPQPWLCGCQEDTVVSAGQLQGCPRLCCPTGRSKGRTWPCRRKGHFPLGWPSLVQCQHRRAALRQQSSAIHFITPARGGQLPDRLQHISVASVSVMKSVSTPSRADGAGLDGTHTHSTVHKIHAYTLNKGLQIKNRIKPDTNDPADMMVSQC